mmetsp:Transcript_13691/g.38544  ORF Transcript_13691/g.38544 Transcript_13691/m.38544 type:complete len:83 (+) Transcript_13691:2375-2623(+)
MTRLSSPLMMSDILERSQSQDHHSVPEVGSTEIFPILLQSPTPPNNYHLRTMNSLPVARMARSSTGVFLLSYQIQKKSATFP